MKFFKNPRTIILVYSITLTCTVSALIASGLYYWFPHFMQVFLLATSFQFIAFFIWNTILQRRDELAIVQMTLQQESIIPTLKAKLACAYCKQMNDLVVAIQNDATFECEYCKLESGIKIQMISTQTVKPVEDVAQKIVDVSKNI